MYDRSYDSEVDVFEFPVTIEDEVGVLSERFDDAVALSEQVALYRGLINILIHTDELGHKLDFLDRYLAHFQDRAWFGKVSDYGDWWRVRESVDMALLSGDGATHDLELRVDGNIDGLTLTVPDGWRYQFGLEGTRQNGQTLVLGPMTDSARLRFSTEP